MSSKDGHNPYRAPTDAQAESVDAISIPSSVASVFLFGFLLIAIQLTEAGYLIWQRQDYQLGVWLFPALPLLLIMALIFDGKVAWACSRYYFGFAFLIGSGMLLVRVVSSTDEFALSEISLLCTLMAHAAIFFSLGHSQSRRYFKLDCPKCGTDYPNSADWLCVRTRCRKCDHQW